MKIKMSKERIPISILSLVGKRFEHYFMSSPTEKLGFGAVLPT